MKQPETFPDEAPHRRYRDNDAELIGVAEGPQLPQPLQFIVARYARFLDQGLFDFFLEFRSQVAPPCHQEKTRHRRRHPPEDTCSECPRPDRAVGGEDRAVLAAVQQGTELALLLLLRNPTRIS